MPRSATGPETGISGDVRAPAGPDSALQEPDANRRHDNTQYGVLAVARHAGATDNVHSLKYPDQTNEREQRSTSGSNPAHRNLPNNCYNVLELHSRYVARHEMSCARLS